MFLAHPAHEIIVGGSLFRWQAEVLYLSRADGGGDSQRETGLQTAAAKCGFLDRCRFLGVSEPELFRRVLDGDINWFRTIRNKVVDWLEEKRPKTLFVDAYEGYNFTHDISPLLLQSALCISNHKPEKHFEVPLGFLDPPVTTPHEPGAPLVRIYLSEEERHFKANLVDAWRGYRGDPETIIAALDEAVMQSDLVRRIEKPRDFLSPPVCGSKVSYEEHGRRRVAEGKYEVALLHAEHYRPIAEALLADSPIVS